MNPEKKIMAPSDKPFSLLIKPASADCNQDCAYCFYSKRSRLYPRQRPRMSAQVLERMVSSYLKTRQPDYIFAWQGGEPTLMGLGFFEKAVQFQREYAAPGSRIANGLQTNALLIDDEFAKFFARNGFLLGVSLDGPEYVHDRYRKRNNGNGSYQDVMKGIDCLLRNEVAFNVLTLVSQANVKNGRDVYRFLYEKGLFYQQYIECVEFDEKSQPLPFAISGEEWGNFLCEIFDEWIQSDIYRVSIRLFDAVLANIVANQTTICTMGPECGRYFVVEHNGDIYPCDFFVDKELKIGNINKDGWLDLLRSPVFADFAARKGKWNNECAECKYRFLCFGDCPKNRFYGQKNPGQKSWLCNGWKIFYEHALPGFMSIRKDLTYSS